MSAYRIEISLVCLITLAGILGGTSHPLAQSPAAIWVADDVTAVDLGRANCLRRPRINGFDFAADGTPVVGWTQVEGCGGSASAGWSERRDGVWDTRPFMATSGIVMGSYEFGLGSDDRPYLYSIGASHEVYRVYRSDLRAQAEGAPSLTDTGEVAGVNQQCVYTRFRLARSGHLSVPHRAMTLGDCAGFGPIRINGLDLVAYVNPRSHDFVVDPSGTSHVAWVDGGGGVFYARPGLSPVRVTAVVRNSDDIGLERGPDGTLHLVVRGFDATADYDRAKLGYLRSTDDGVTWTLVDYIDASPTWGVDLELDAHGVPTVAYWAFNQLRYATRASGAWVASTIAVPAWDGVEWLVQPRLRYDAGGAPHVAYYDWSANRVRVLSPAPAGADVPVDVSVSGSTSPNPIVAGGRVTYTVRVSNHSTRTATGMTVRVVLPPGAQLVASTPAPVSNENGLLTFHGWRATGELQRTLGPGTTAALTFDLAGLPEGEPVVAISVSASEADPDATNNEALVRTRVAAATCQLPMTGRTAWWPGDGTPLNYGAGSLYHGTPVGGVSYTAGAVGGAFRFDGATGYLHVPNGYPEYYWPGTSAMSVGAWFSTEATTTAVQVIASMDDMANAPCCGSPQGHAAWYLYVQNGTLRASMRPTPYGSGGVVLTGLTPVADGRFHHAVLVIDIPALQARLYLDGALDASAPLPGGWAMSNGDFEVEPLVIGAAPVLWGEGYRDFFNGVVDDVSLYKRALTPQEIADAAAGPSLAACRVNQVPVAVDDAVTTDADTPVVIPAALLLANDTDADGDALLVTGVTGALNGTVSLGVGEIVFTPSAGFAGDASFVYVADDARGGSASATVRVTVSPPPPPPAPAVVVTAPETQDAYLGREVSFAVSVTALNAPEAVGELTWGALPPGASVTRESSGSTSVYRFRWTPVLTFTTDGTPQWGNVSVVFMGHATWPSGERIASTGLHTVNLRQGASAVLAMEGRRREFTASHPDFESPDGDAGRVLVASTLGAGRKPVFSPDGPVSTIDGPTTFDQWWRDGPASTAAPYTLHLSNALQADARIFEFSSSAFVTGGAYFTFEAHGRAPYLPGQVLRFVSADDLWVFVNGRLAVDLGGVHAPAGAQLDLDARAADLGLVPGETFALDLFYAHRGTHPAALTVQVPEGYEAVAVPVNAPPGLPELGETIAFEGTPITRRVYATDPDRDPISFAIVGLPPGITPTAVPDAAPPYLDLSGRPPAGSAGTYEATLTVSDGVNTLTRPWRWVVRTPNSAPIARDDAAVAQPWSVIVIPVLANDSDPEGDSLRIVEVTEPRFGHVTIGGTEVVYARTSNDVYGTDRFTYTIEDAFGRTASADVTVRLLAPGVNLVARSAPRRYVRPGETFDLDVTITNEGSEPAEGVTATLDVPGLTLVAVSAPVEAGRLVLGPIPAGGAVRVALTLLADREPGSWSLRATAEAEAEDWRTLADNTSTTTVDVQPDFCFIPQPGLRGFWNADAGWDAVAGSMAGFGPPNSLAPSRVGQAFLFTGDVNGAGQFTSSRPLPKAFTVAAWARRDPAASAVAPVVMVTGPTSFGFNTGERYWLGFEDGYPVLTLFGAGDDAGQLRALTPVAPSTWVHLAATYDGETARLFVNGVEAAVRQVDVEWYDATAGTIGAAWAGGLDGLGTAFTGLVDDVAIYDRALGPDDVGRLTNGSPACVVSRSPSLVVTLTGTPNPTGTNSPVSLTATVTNTGDGYLEWIVLTAVVDELLELRDVFPAESSPARWELPALLPGESFTLTGVVQTPDLDGHFPVSVTASAGDGTSVPASLLVTAVPEACIGDDGVIDPDCDVNDRPVLQSPGDQVSRVGDVVSLVVRATDADGDPVTYSAVGLPAGLTLEAGTGVITGTILSDGSGPHRVTITATDGRLIGRTAFNWTVPHRLSLTIGRGATVQVNESTCDARLAARQCLFDLDQGADLFVLASIDPAVGAAEPWWTGDSLTQFQKVTRSLQAELLVLKRFPVAIDHPALFPSLDGIRASVPVLYGTYLDFRSALPEFLACSGGQDWSCEGRAAVYSTVTLEGGEDSVAVFDRFSGSCTGTTCAITLDRDHAVTMHFTPRDVRVILQRDSRVVMQLDDLTAGTRVTCSEGTECVVPVPYGHRVRVSNATPGDWQHWQWTYPGVPLANDRPAEFTAYFDSAIALRLRSRIAVEVHGSAWTGAGPPPIDAVASSAGEDVAVACTPGSPAWCTMTVEAFTSANLHATGSPAGWTGCTTESTTQWCRVQATAPVMAITLHYETPNTPAGTGVDVVATGTGPVIDLRFAQVTSPGVTRYDSHTGGLLPPEGFSFGTPPEWYDIHTSATFTGAATVCIRHATGRFEDPSGVRLFHQEAGRWVDRTVSVDARERRVCGSVTSLSPFALAEPVGIEGRMHGEFELRQRGATVDVRFTIAERPLGQERGSLRLTLTMPVAARGGGRKATVDRFESARVDAIAFVDRPAFSTGRSPTAPAADGAAFTGTGAWNGAPGYRFEARAVDAGEPGRGRDRFAITIRDPDGVVVATADAVIEQGNIQSDRLDRRPRR